MTSTPNSQGKVIEVSLVLPAYNEVECLKPAVEKTMAALTKFTDSYEILIAEDGSTDGTAERSAELAQKYPFVRHIHRDQRLGRGTALNNAFKQCNGRFLAYMDLDLATDLSYLKPLIEAISVEGYDFSTGSRMLKGSQAERTFSRSISSKTYNWLVRQMLGSKLYDHQCGFKAFKREPLFSLLDKVKATHWFWDTEILVRAQQEHSKVKEIAVEWHSGKDTKVNVAKDAYNMFKQIMALWWTIKVKKK
jgi:glycosyltransferase AglD